jgi:hypothetical protein
VSDQLTSLLSGEDVSYARVGQFLVGISEALAHMVYGDAFWGA